MARTIAQDTKWVAAMRDAATTLAGLLDKVKGLVGEADDMDLPAALAPEALQEDNLGLTADEFAAAKVLATALIATLETPPGPGQPAGRAILNAIKR